MLSDVTKIKPLDIKAYVSRISIEIKRFLKILYPNHCYLPRKSVSCISLLTEKDYCSAAISSNPKMTSWYIASFLYLCLRKALGNIVVLNNI